MQTIKTKNSIYVTFQKVGYHRYPNAPSEPFDVSYLKSTHRHLFKFKVFIQVFHEDRDIEFHQFLNWVESLYEKELKLDYKSCEMISDELNSKIAQKYPNRKVSIDISEDGECGSFCEYENNDHLIIGGIPLTKSPLEMLDEDIHALSNPKALG